MESPSNFITGDFTTLPVILRHFKAWEKMTGNDYAKWEKITGEWEKITFKWEKITG